MKKALILGVVLCVSLAAAFAGLRHGQHGNPIDLSGLSDWERHQMAIDPAYGRELLASLPSSRACLSTYGQRDPTKDATNEALKDSGKFFYYWSEGAIAYPTVDGLPLRCSPSSLNGDRNWKVLNTYNGEPGDGGFQSSLTERCIIKARAYLKVFNERLATLRPDLFLAACGPSGKKRAPGSSPG